jgi:hypothetical protein
MSDSIPRDGRSTAVILGIVALLALAIIYAAIAVLFGSLFSTFPPTRIGETSLNLDLRGATVLQIGEMRLNSEFSLNGLLIFGLLCLLSAYGGLAAIWRWPRWTSVARAAGCATILLSIYGIWTFLTMVAPGPPFPFPVIGIQMPIHVSLAAGVIGVLVLAALRNPVVKNP